MIKVVAFILLNIACFFLGIYAYKNESSRKKLQDFKRIFDFSYDHYSQGKNASPDTLSIILSDENYATISQNRDKAVALGVLADDFKDEVRGKLRWKNDTLNCKLRLKGDYPDHWSGDKWSFRINIKGQSSFNGMDKFSIQAPETRKGIYEWYYHQLLKNEGLIALRYAFAHVRLNEVDKGIFAVEESFSKELLENNGRREAPILKFEESSWISEVISHTNKRSQLDHFFTTEIDVFGSKKTLKDSLKNSYFQKGKHLLNSLRLDQLPLHEALDIESAARLFAIGDLTGSYHGLRWHNQRFYYNPIINRLELIGFDSGAGVPISATYYDLWKDGQITEQQGLFYWKNIFFQNPIFVEAYFSALKRISSIAYLDAFERKVKWALEEQLTYLYSENASYQFLPETFRKNAEVIRESISNYEINMSNKKAIPGLIKTFLNKTDEAKLEFSIQNNSFTQVKFNGILDSSGRLIKASTQSIIPERLQNRPAQYFSISLDTIPAAFPGKRDRKGNKYALENFKSQFLVDDTVVVTDIFINPSEINFPLTTFSNDYLPFLNDQQEVTVSENLIIPEGVDFVIPPGKTIHFINGASLISYSPVRISGTKDAPVRLSSPDQSGSFIVMNADGESVLNHVYFDGFTASDSTSPYAYSGSVNFYRSDVKMNHVEISNNHSEDALNIVNANYTIRNLSFYHIQSDAFDSDFSIGSIDNVTFTNIGNDALDFSGSKAIIREMKADSIGDKAISVGEKSKVKLINATILQANYGLVSKDWSFLDAEGIHLEAVANTLLAFQKKREYGGAQIYITDLNITQSQLNYSLEYGSKITIQGRERLEPNSLNIAEKLYTN